MPDPLRVTVWSEFRHEKKNPKVAAIYPDGIHGAIAAGLAEHGIAARTATLDETECGLSAAVLAETDVLTWWGHLAHKEVPDEVAERVVQRVWDGMGLVVLHSGHHSKPFRRLMGTSCDLSWREGDDHERVWVVNPGHPIAADLPDYFELGSEEMYGEFFDVPQPDELVLVSWFSGGEVFRSGMCYSRGAGRVFYFRPGHETFPTYLDANVRRVIANGVRWAAPTGGARRFRNRAVPPEELRG
ncbi:MAG TPA: ThuA domain-containing protein [Deinococcales bacterium]|nr:ThuA domain-containing protein [Deinococcales bacterium]